MISWSFNQTHLVLSRQFFRSLEGIVSRVVRAFDVEVIVIFKNNRPTAGRPAGSGCWGRARTNTYALNSLFLIIGFLVCSARHYVFLLCGTRHGVISISDKKAVLVRRGLMSNSILSLLNDCRKHGGNQGKNKQRGEDRNVDPVGPPNQPNDANDYGDPEVHSPHHADPLG